jgi:hypothetical protein
VAGLAFGLELLLDDDLRRDARMVGADLPERVVAAHPMPADEHVHQRLLERVTHVQRAGDVRRRQLDAVRIAIRPHRRLEYPRDSHSGYHFASTACGSKLFGSSMNGAKSVDYSDRCRSPYGGAHIATAFGP